LVFFVSPLIARFSRVTKIVTLSQDFWWFRKKSEIRHSGESRSPDVVLRIKYVAGSAKAGNDAKDWIPASAGMTN
jgi:hypothetical protein